MPITESNQVFVAIERVNANRKGYWPGDEITGLSEEQAARLISLKVIKPKMATKNVAEGTVMTENPMPDVQGTVNASELPSSNAAKNMSEKIQSPKSNKRRVKRGTKKSAKRPFKSEAATELPDTFKAALPKKENGKKKRGPGRPSLKSRS